MADRIQQRRQHHRRMAKKRRKRAQGLFGLVLVCAALAFGITYLMLYRSVSKYPDQIICDHVYIGAMDASGMTKKEALQALKEHLAEDRSKTVTLRVGEENAQATLEEMGISYQNMEKTVDKAVSYGKDGGVFSRYMKLRKLKKEKVVISENIRVDQEQATAIPAARPTNPKSLIWNAAISATKAI